MGPSVSVEAHLENVREKLGEAHFRKEVRRLAKNGIRMGGQHEIFWRDLVQKYEWLNVEELLAEPEEPRPSSGGGSMPGMPSGIDPTNLIIQAMRQQMPGLRTQAQFNAFMAAFDALRVHLNFVFEGNTEKATEAKQALESAIEFAAKATEVSDQLRDVPEAATSPAAQEFKNPPAQFQEYDVQKSLLVQLARIETLPELTQWYNDTKEQRDRVVSQSLRNVLMDEIRRKKVALTEAEGAS
jgi:hypothetical protein